MYIHIVEKEGRKGGREGGREERSEDARGDVVFVIFFCREGR